MIITYFPFGILISTEKKLSSRSSFFALSEKLKGFILADLILS